MVGRPRTFDKGEKIMKYTVQATQLILNEKPTRVKQRFLIEADSEEEAYRKCQSASKRVGIRSGSRKVPVLNTHYLIVNE